MSVGFSPEAVPLPFSKVMFFELEIKGSLGCPPSRYPVIVDLVRRGKFELASLVSGVFPLDQVNAALNKLRQGEGLECTGENS